MSAALEKRSSAPQAAAQQVVEAVGFHTSIARLIRDRDRIYGARFDARVNHLGIEQARIAPRAPWRSGCAERFVGTLRREVLDHVIVLGERHLLRLVRAHERYYNEDRPHMSLDSDAPVSRAVEVPGTGRVVALSRVGGLHHRYARAARAGATSFSPPQGGPQARVRAVRSARYRGLPGNLFDLRRAASVQNLETIQREQLKQAA